MKLKRYTVEISNWYGGECHDFWTNRGAVKFINESPGKWDWIKLIDSWKGITNTISRADARDCYRTEDGRYIKKDGK
jgi:hypothetical protein